MIYILACECLGQAAAAANTVLASFYFRDYDVNSPRFSSFSLRLFLV